MSNEKGVRVVNQTNHIINESGIALIRFLAMEINVKIKVVFFPPVHNLSRYNMPTTEDTVK